MSFRLHLVLLATTLVSPGANGAPVAAGAQQQGLSDLTPHRRGRLSSHWNGEIVLTGKRYEVHVHFDDVPVAKRALATVEAVWPVAMEWLGAAGSEPPFPMEGHLYPDREAYLEVESLLTDGWFRDNGSFAHWTSKTAHVEMSPPLTGRAAERLVLSGQTREVLLHEAAHLAVYAVLPTYRFHPRWFSEGLAMGIEQEAARRLGLLRDPGDHPRYSTDQLLVKRLLERDALPSVARVFGDDLDALQFHERYAVQLELLHLIVEEQPAAFRSMIAEAKRLPGGGAFRQGMAAFVERTFDLPELDARLRERVEELDPRWYMDYRAFQVDGARWTQAAFPDQPAVVWSNEPSAGEHYRLSGSAELLGAEMRVLLDHRGWNHVEVALSAAGELVVRRVEEEQARDLVAVPCEELRGDGPHRFAIEVDGSTLRVRLEGSERLELDLGGEALSGGWGLGVPAGGAGVWTGVERVP